MQCQSVWSNNDLDKIEALIFAIEVRDAYTQGHSRRVACYAGHLAAWMGMHEPFIAQTYRAGMVHDLGKVGIPDDILLKSGRLSVNEYDLIKLHSTLSAKIIEKLGGLNDLLPAVRHHHEHFDGSGYPDGLIGEEIPLMARIITIADTFDALTTRRIYRSAMSMEQSIAIMDQEIERGKYDPHLYALFRARIEELGIFDQTHLSQFAYPELEAKRNSFHFKDPLTDLLNKNALLNHLRQSANDRESGVLIEINLKRFSHFNRDHGLEAGDALLIATAEQLRLALQCGNAFESPLPHRLYLYRGYADRFYLFCIGCNAKGTYAHIKETISRFELPNAIQPYCKVLLDAAKIPTNIDHAIGYLL